MEETSMDLTNLKPAAGSNKKAWRKGRGIGSGNGKTAGRGHKGQNARSGGGVRPGFEGGQMPLYRRLPKRGFNNARFAKKYACVNVGDLNSFRAGSVITAEKLMEAGLVDKVLDGVKIMGNGELTKKLTIKAHKFTAGAMTQIEKLEGKAEVV